MENEHKADKKTKVKVDAATYLDVQMAKCDDDIAEAEIIVQRSQLRVAELKKVKSKVLIDYHYKIVKDMQMQQEKSQQLKKEVMDEVKSEKTDSKEDAQIAEVVDDTEVTQDAEVVKEDEKEDTTEVSQDAEVVKEDEKETSNKTVETTGSTPV